jgi:bifunctional DNA-binding transcriptional regulator/antitoxin component of YhaV-PrlF toxin-antitoxin module
LYWYQTRPCLLLIVNRTSAKPSNMSKVQLHYDGWVTLPAAALKKLGLATGDRLEVGLTRDAIVLRRAQKASAAERATAEPVPVAAQTPVVTPEPVATVAPSPVVKRGPGRPRKTPTSAAALPPSLKTRGRRRKAMPAAEAPAL